MFFSRLLQLTIAVLLLAGPLVSAQCGEFPEALASDCFAVMNDNLGDDSTAPCDGSGHAVIAYQSCAATTRCDGGLPNVTNNDLAVNARTILYRCSNPGTTVSGLVAGSSGGYRTCLLNSGRSVRSCASSHRTRLMLRQQHIQLLSMSFRRSQSVNPTL